MNDEQYKAALAMADLLRNAHVNVPTSEARMVERFVSAVDAETDRRTQQAADLADGRAVRVEIPIGVDSDGEVFVGDSRIRHEDGIVRLGWLHKTAAQSDSVALISKVVPVPQPTEIEAKVEAAGEHGDG